MEFTRFRNVKFDFQALNGTQNSLPSTLLDALIPGYGIFYQVVLRLLGFDIGLLVSGCLVLFGLSKGVLLIYARAYSLFASYFTSSVQIDDEDQLFTQIMGWIAEQHMTRVSRDIKAVTKWVSAYEDNDLDGDDEQNSRDEDVLDETGIFNYEKWASNIPPQYEPNYGADKFWFEGRQFSFSRSRREKPKSFWSNSDDQYLVVSCVGRSTEPIKKLLNHIKKWTLAKEKRMTSVYRPAPKEDRSRESSWDRQSCRPSRPMDTISLDLEQKVSIVADINEFLQPDSSRWYAARGIPYRRGYMFYGPPGTGKTSLSFALAGIFGLNIYCISLMEVGLTESDLSKLFTTLPRRCIVLLEDIDSAGLRRADDPPPMTDGLDAHSDGTSSEDGVKVSKPDAPIAPTGFKSLISLSGLLNTIDGAASHEGRVLIMTTNHPEKLDPALTRPGRVDLQVRFTLATREQTREIFIRMYSTKRDKKSLSSRKTEVSEEKSQIAKSKKAPTGDREEDEFYRLLAQKPLLDVVEPTKLKAMAEEFAQKIPEAKFSPAEIQGFLLTRKKEPRRALGEVEAWRDALLEQKKSGGKVVTVQ